MFAAVAKRLGWDAAWCLFDWSLYRWQLRVVREGVALTLATMDEIAAAEAARRHG